MGTDLMVISWKMDIMSTVFYRRLRKLILFYSRNILLKKQDGMEMKIHLMNIQISFSSGSVASEQKKYGDFLNMARKMLTMEILILYIQLLHQTIVN